MNLRETVLFEKCPLCSEAKITLHRAWFSLYSEIKIGPCPKCSAEFASKGEDNYQLVYCDPRKLAGTHRCEGQLSRGCLLDATFSRADWRKIADGEESPSLAKYLEASAMFRDGKLPTHTLEKLPFTLEKGESLHHISSSVHLGDREHSFGDTADKGSFYVTSRKCAFAYSLGTIIIPFEDIEEVEDSPPGFAIRERNCFEPRCFYPPSFDPVLAALQGAMHIFKSKS